MRSIALIDNVDVIERILKHLKLWDPQSEIISLASAGSALLYKNMLSLSPQSVYSEVLAD